MRVTRWLFAMFVLLIGLTGCNVALSSFTVPSRVWAGEVFEVVVEGFGDRSTGDAAAILQLPQGFVVEGAVVAVGGRAIVPGLVTRDLLSVLALLASEPGHYLTSFSGGFVLSHSGSGARLKVYVRAPQAVGPFTLKAAVAGSSNTGGFQVTDPGGVASFAAITAGRYVQATQVDPDPVSPFVIDTLGLLTPRAHAASTGVAFGDVDGDGNDDLGHAVSAPSFVSHQIYYGRSPGTSVFLSRPGSAWVRTSTPAARGSYLRVAFGDFDGDGHLDLADTAGRVVFGDGGSTWTPGPALPLLASDQGGVAVGDVDGDGLDDVAFGALTTDAVQVFRSQGNRTFAEWSGGLPNATSGSAGTACLVLQDLTGDGHCDILASGGIGSRAWTGDGRGGWRVSPGLPPFTSCFEVGDLDRNGRVDLVFSTANRSVEVYEFAAGAWRPRSMAGAPTGGGPSLATAQGILDYDRDGWPDLALAFSSDAVLLRNIGGQSWGAPQPLSALTASFSLVDFAVGDIDGDSWPDLAAAVIGEHPLVWRNTGTGLSPYGEPCSAVGVPTPGMAASGTLQIGSGNFAFELQGMRPGGAGLVWIGLSKRYAFGQPILPFELGALGAPDCAVVASAEVPSFLVADAMGRGRVAMAIPNDPTLRRVTVFAQGAAHAPGANTLGWLLSGGLAAKIP